MFCAALFSVVLLGPMGTPELVYPADLDETPQQAERARDVPLVQIASEAAAASGGAVAGAALGGATAALMVQQIVDRKVPLPPDSLLFFANIAAYAAVVGLVAAGAGGGAALATCLVAFLFQDKDWPWVVAPAAGLAAGAGSTLAVVAMGAALVVVVVTVFREVPVENAPLIVYGSVGAGLTSAALLLTVPAAAAVAITWSADLAWQE